MTLSNFECYVSYWKRHHGDKIEADEGIGMIV